MAKEKCKALEVKSAGTEHRHRRPSAEFDAIRQSTKKEMEKQAIKVESQACGQNLTTLYELNYFNSDLVHNKGGQSMSWGDQNWNQDAKTPSGSRPRSKKPGPAGLSPVSNTV